MADTVLKLAPEPGALAEAADAMQRRSRRARARMLLLVIVPALALGAGLGFYLMGGRYISTDNAYVGAQKVLITPDVSGKVNEVLIKEGQHVAAGDPLFKIDSIPFDLALKQAEGKLEASRTNFASLKSNYKSLVNLIDMMRQTVDLKRRDLDRKTSLVTSHAGTQVDVDNAMSALLTTQLELQLGQQQLDTVVNQLLGNPDLRIEDYPPYQQNKAALDQARRDLDHTVIRAPIPGTATQVDNIQLGRYVTAGMSVFSIINDTAPWVDANPKETDITYLHTGEKVDIEVDSFSGHVFHGTVASVSPGTGAQFAILPPQNASGNWVKVVQRVPVRIVFDEGQDVSDLRAGMSVNVDIDTGRSRSLSALLGIVTSYAKGSPQQ